MKKVFIILLLPLLWACQKEEFSPETDENLELTTRAAVSVPNPLSELDGIPVNIRLLGNGDGYKYLSSSKKGTAIDLWTMDDGTLRQRWNLKFTLDNNIPIMPGYCISTLGGTEAPGQISVAGSPSNYYPYLLFNLSFYSIFNFESIPNTNYYYIYQPYLNGSGHYLCSDQYNGRNLVVKPKSQTGGRDRWEIIPLERFEIINIQYAYVYGDSFIIKPEVLKSSEWDNPFDTPASYDFMVSEERSFSSKFSDTQGISTSNKITNSYSTGVPTLSDDKLTINTEFTTSTSYNYTKEEQTQSKLIITDKITYQLPPHSRWLFQSILYTYKVDLTYVATLRGTTTGRVIRLPGRWEGVQGRHVETKVTDLLNNRVVDTRTKILENI